MNMARILAPLVLCIVCGIVLGKWRNLRPKSFVTAVMDLFMPALVFDALLSAKISLTEMLTTGLASGVIIALMFILCLMARPVIRQPIRNFALPVLFMNAGFLGMPLMDIAYGREALGRIVVFDQVQSFFMLTLGIWIAAGSSAAVPERVEKSPAGHFERSEKSLAGGRTVDIHVPFGTWPSMAGGSFKAFFREPLIYSIVIAVTFRIAKLSVPESVLSPIRFLGSVTPPLALFALGLRLAHTPMSFISNRAILKKMSAIMVLRFAGGLACGYAAIAILHLEDMTRQVVLIASALPSAVFSYILAERYQADPDLAAAAVFTTTILFFPLLPLLLRLAA